MLPGIDDLDPPTRVVPRVAPPPPPSRLRTMLPWAGFGLVAVTVVTATSLWAASVHTGRQAEAFDTAAPPSMTATTAPPTTPEPPSTRPAVVTTAAHPRPVVVPHVAAPVPTTPAAAPTTAPQPTATIALTPTRVTAMATRTCRPGSRSCPTEVAPVPVG